MNKTDIQKKVLDYLEEEDWYAIKTIMLDKSGMSDIIAFKDGVTMFLEVKSPGTKLTPLQKNRLKTLREKGFISNVIYRLDDLKIVLMEKKIEETRMNYIIRVAQLISDGNEFDSDWKVKVLRLFVYGKNEEALKEINKKTQAT